MQKQLKYSYPSQSPPTNTQPTNTHKPNKHTTQQNQQAHNATKPTSTPHKNNKHTSPKQTNPHNNIPTQPATAAPTAEHSGPWVSTNIAEPGFNPGTFGLWAQHANHCATPLLLKRVKNFHLMFHQMGSGRKGGNRSKKEQKVWVCWRWLWTFGLWAQHASTPAPVNCAHILQWGHGQQHPAFFHASTCSVPFLFCFPLHSPTKTTNPQNNKHTTHKNSKPTKPTNTQPYKTSYSSSRTCRQPARNPQNQQTQRQNTHQSQQTHKNNKHTTHQNNKHTKPTNTQPYKTSNSSRTCRPPGRNPQNQQTQRQNTHQSQQTHKNNKHTTHQNNKPTKPAHGLPLWKNVLRHAFK